jgi:hypothetical protein
MTVTTNYIVRARSNVLDHAAALLDVLQDAMACSPTGQLGLYFASFIWQAAVELVPQHASVYQMYVCH